MQTYLLVDGYNVINSWQKFAELRQQNLEHAREQLTNDIANYVAFQGYKGIVVFDAMQVPGRAKQLNLPGVEVVYTAEGETADSWIEQRVHDLQREQVQVYVVTSDYAEQINIFGSGGYRISAREFYEKYQKTQREIEIHSHTGSGFGRNELGERLGGAEREEFERMRRNLLT